VLLMGMWIVCCMVPGWRPGEESCRRCAAWRELGRSCSASDGKCGLCVAWSRAGARGKRAVARCAAWRELGRSCGASDGNVDCVLHGPGLAPGGKRAVAAVRLGGS
jgi:hypothetical protein